MIIDSQDFKTFFEVAYDVTDINNLRCLKCGRKITELEDQSGLICLNSHKIGYLEYMTTYANILKGIADNAELSNIAFTEKIIEPSNIMYISNEILFIDKQIIRS